MKVKSVVLSGVLLLAALGGGLGVWRIVERPPAAPAPAAVVPVTVIPVRMAAMPVLLKATGTVQPDATVAVRSRIDGQIAEVHVGDGAEVTAGQLLFSLDDRSQRVAVQQAEAQLARDQAQLADAKREMDRYGALPPGEVVTRQKLDQTRTAFEVAQANVKADQATLAAAQVELSYTRIEAPIDGRVGFVDLKQGTVVRAADATSLVVINRIHPVQVSFSLPQQSLAAIRANQAQDALRVTAKTAAGPVQGRLAYIDNRVDPATGTIALRALFDNRDEKLWPGQLVDTSLTLAVQSKALVVPDQAIQQSQKGPLVWVITPDNTATPRDVTVDRSIEGQSVVSEGLAANDMVVLDGQFRLSPGAKVTPRPAAGQEASR